MSRRRGGAVLRCEIADERVVLDALTVGSDSVRVEKYRLRTLYAQDVNGALKGRLSPCLARPCFPRAHRRWTGRRQVAGPRRLLRPRRAPG
jgi:hypothetical protein